MTKVGEEMERFDFVSVMACLQKHISEDLYQNQTDLMYKLFVDFVDDSEFDFDNGLVNKWLRGQAKLSPQISLYYRTVRHQYALCTTIERTILPMMDDTAMAVQELHDLLIQDLSVSQQKKEEFDENEDMASQLTQMLCFAMSRNFEKRESTRECLKAAGGMSPVLKDLIIDNGVPKPCRWFCGREKELEELHELLLVQDKVFLHGIPGIGKSEMAKAYAQRHRKLYRNILYIPIVDDLRQAIIDVDFVDDLPTEDDDQRFRKHNRFLRSLREDSLIIVDNFNAAEDELLDVICNYRCRVLFTTRSRFNHCTSLELKELDQASLLRMVEYFYSGAQKNREIIDSIIDSVHGHTFAVELTARLLESGILRPRRLLEKLRAEKTALDADDKIRISKDGRSGKATYHDHIHMLFALFRLNRKEQAILRNMALMPVTGISARLFGNWLGLRNLNAVNELIDIGMIQPGCCRTVLLHPMIREVVMAELRPSITACELLIDSLQIVCKNRGQKVSCYREVFQVVDNLMTDAAKDDMTRYLRFLEDVHPYMAQYHEEASMERVIDELTVILQDEAMGDSIDRAWLLNYHASRESNTKKAIALAVDALERLGDKIGKDAAPVAAALHSRLGGLYLQDETLHLARLHFEEGIALLEKFHLSTQYDSVLQIVQYTYFVAERKEYDLGLKMLNRIDRNFQKEKRNDTLEYAAIKECIAMLHLMEGRIDDGFAHYQKTREIWQMIFADEPERVKAKEDEIQRNCKDVGTYIAKRMIGYI